MEDVFLKGLPRIDLHGFDSQSAYVATNDFLNENLILGNSKILIVHGKGTGTIKRIVHSTLQKRKEVLKYHTDNNNDGCTIVYLILDK